MKSNNAKNLAVFLVAAVLLLALPLLLQTQGNAWVRIVDIALNAGKVSARCGEPIRA